MPHDFKAKIRLLSQIEQQDAANTEKLLGVKFICGLFDHKSRQIEAQRQQDAKNANPHNR